MNTDKTKRARVERALSEAYRRQDAPAPSGSWRQAVLACVRQSPRPSLSPQPHRLEEEIAWRVAWAAVALALVITAVGITVPPSASQLDWQVQENGTVFESSLGKGN